MSCLFVCLFSSSRTWDNSWDNFEQNTVSIEYLVEPIRASNYSLFLSFAKRFSSAANYIRWKDENYFLICPNELKNSSIVWIVPDSIEIFLIPFYFQVLSNFLSVYLKQGTIWQIGCFNCIMVTVLPGNNGWKKQLT